VPPWSWHQHESASAADAILFAVTDEPIMQTLGLYREEPLALRDTDDE
jgi:gentisate 1,2-dioxygenase